MLSRNIPNPVSLEGVESPIFYFQMARIQDFMKDQNGKKRLDNNKKSWTFKFGVVGLRNFFTLSLYWFILTREIIVEYPLES